MLIGIDGFRLTGNKRTGKETYVRNLLNELVVIDKNNNYLFFVRESTGIQYPSNVREIVLKNYKSYTFWNQIILPLKALKYKVNLMMYMESMLPFFSTTKSLLFVLDLSFIIIKKDFDKKTVLILGSTIQNSVRNATKIVAISESTKSDIVRLLKIKPDKIEVVYPTLPDELINRINVSANYTETLEKYKIRGNYIIVIGSTHKYKNISNLIAAFSILKKSLKKEDLQLVIVGMYTNKFFDSNIAPSDLESIVFTNYVSDNELVILLKQAEVFVFPSLYEGFGIPILEAFAFGVPAAVSDISSLPEVLGDAGVLFDPFSAEDIASKIELLLVSTPFANDLVVKGAKRLNDFNKKNEALKLLKNINSINVTVP